MVALDELVVKGGVPGLEDALAGVEVQRMTGHASPLVNGLGVKWMVLSADGEVPIQMCVIAWCASHAEALVEVEQQNASDCAMVQLHPAVVGRLRTRGGPAGT